jgi:F-type H+-transporting ATPase subunit alpha
VGGDAQTKGMKQVAGQLKGDMAAFRELAAFATFGSDLDKATQRQLDRGYRLTEILKQAQYEPQPLANQIMVMYAGTRGYCDTVPVEKMKAWEAAFTRFMETSFPEIGRDIAEKKLLSEQTEAKLKDAIKAFATSWQS